jgi:transcriptional regulator with XRE-family HTH domain
MTSQSVDDYTRWGLKIALMQQGIKQSHIAKAMGKDPAWVSRVVRGWIDPSEADTARMASVLNLDVDELRTMFASVA